MRRESGWLYLTFNQVVKQCGACVNPTQMQFLKSNYILLKFSFSEKATKICANFCGLLGKAELYVGLLSCENIYVYYIYSMAKGNLKKKQTTKTTTLWKLEPWGSLSPLRPNYVR